MPAYFSWAGIAQLVLAKNCYRCGLNLNAFHFVGINLNSSPRFDDRLLSLFQEPQWSEEDDKDYCGPGLVVAGFTFRGS